MNEVQIHPTAIVDPRRGIGAGTVIGPYCLVAAGVVLGRNAGCSITSHFAGRRTAGAGNRFYAYGSIGQQTQELKYRGEPTYLEIGDENCFREFVTVNRGTTARARRASGTAEIFSPTATSATIARRRRVIFSNNGTLAGPRPGGRSRGHRRSDGGASILPDRALMRSRAAARRSCRTFRPS